MEKLKSNSLKVLFVIALLCPAVFADDGEMGSGGFAGSDTPPATVKTVQSLDDGEMGSGGRSSGISEHGTYLDSMLGSIYEYLDSVM